MPVPKTMIITLRTPVETAFFSGTWGIDAQFYIRGERVDVGEMPWVSMPDVLLDRETRHFVGLTFAIDRELWDASRAIVGKLDPGVIRYNDLTSVEAQMRYPGEAGMVHRCELQWAPATQLEEDVAQLMSSQWWCLYAHTGTDRAGLFPPRDEPANLPVGFALTDIDDVLRNHSLIFPEVRSAGLDARFT